MGGTSADSRTPPHCESTSPSPTFISAKRPAFWTRKLDAGGAYDTSDYDDAALGWHVTAVDHGQVALLDFALRKRLAQAALGLDAARKDHEAGRGHVEPVHDQGVGKAQAQAAVQAILQLWAAAGRLTDVA